MYLFFCGSRSLGGCRDSGSTGFNHKKKFSPPQHLHHHQVSSTPQFFCAASMLLIALLCSSHLDCLNPVTSTFNFPNLFQQLAFPSFSTASFSLSHWNYHILATKKCATCSTNSPLYIIPPTKPHTSSCLHLLPSQCACLATFVNVSLL